MNAARCLLFAALLLVTVAAGSGQEAAPQPAVAQAQAGDEFTDKIALIFLDAQMRSPSWVLSHVELKEIGGRMFLTGIGADTQRENDWRGGKKTRVAWTSVTGYMLFSAEEYAKHLKESQESD